MNYDTRKLLKSPVLELPAGFCYREQSRLSASRWVVRMFSNNGGTKYVSFLYLGITLLTVSHRPSLWKYHERVFKFDGEGGWTIEEMNANKRLTFHDEKALLESQLKGVPNMKNRLQELCVLLGENVHLDGIDLSDLNSRSQMKF